MQTTENAGHTHEIKKDALWTEVTNNHRHKMSTGCNTCNKVRTKVFAGNMMTSFNHGHAHFFSPKELNEE